MGLSTLKNLLRNIDATFTSDRITVAEISRRGGDLATKIEKAQKTEDIIERVRRCKTAGQVFTEFSKDAAQAKIDEMLFGPTSGDRQRAQETILEYALGKPINRTLSFSGRIAESSDEELKYDIERLLVELGFQTGEGKISSLFMGVKGSTRQVEAAEVQTQPRISDKLCKIPEEN